MGIWEQLEHELRNIGESVFSLERVELTAGMVEYVCEVETFAEANSFELRVVKLTADGAIYAMLAAIRAIDRARGTATQETR